MIHLALAACVLGAHGTAAPAAQPSPDLLFPAASGPLEIPSGSDAPSHSYLWLVKQYAELTNQHFALTDEAEALLNQEQIRLDQPLSVPAEEVQETVECLLRQAKFFMNVSKADGVRLLDVASLHGMARNTARASAHYLEVDDVELARKHPAVLFTAAVPMPNTDVRQLSNSMRTMLTDANTQQLLPAGNAGALVIVGFGDQVADFCAMTRWIDDPEQAASLPQDQAALFPEAKGPLEITIGDPETTPSMLQLVKEYGALTGQALTWNADTEMMLKANPVSLDRSITAPAAEVQQVFESILSQSDFALTVLKSEGVRVLKVSSLSTNDRNSLRSSAKFLAPSHLELAAKHPATMFSTVLTMPNTDVRQVSNSMRTLITDANTQAMIPGGGSNSMILVGFGDSIVQYASMLEVIDDASAMAARDAAPKFVAVRLENAKADEVVALLMAAFGIVSADSSDEKSKAMAQVMPGPIRFLSEANTNSILVAAPEDRMEGLRSLITALDR